MKIFFFILAFSLSLASCTREDSAGATGSGAGIEKEEAHDDANITTPINQENDRDAN